MANIPKLDHFNQEIQFGCPSQQVVNCNLDGKASGLLWKKKTPINLKITNWTKTKVIHTNWVQHRSIPQTDNTLPTHGHSSSNWYPPVSHHVIGSASESRYPQCNRRPPVSTLVPYRIVSNYGPGVYFFQATFYPGY